MGARVAGRFYLVQQAIVRILRRVVRFQKLRIDRLGRIDAGLNIANELLGKGLVLHERVQVFRRLAGCLQRPRATTTCVEGRDQDGQAGGRRAEYLRIDVAVITAGMGEVTEETPWCRHKSSQPHVVLVSIVWEGVLADRNTGGEKKFLGCGNLHSKPIRQHAADFLLPRHYALSRADNRHTPFPFGSHRRAWTAVEPDVARSSAQPGAKYLSGI